MLSYLNYNISNIQQIYMTLLQEVKSYPPFLNNAVVIGHSSSMCETDMGLVQIHFTFCENVVFHAFTRILYITMAKYLGQESIPGLFLSRSYYKAFSSFE